jgi:hypothetical protein
MLLSNSSSSTSPVRSVALCEAPATEPATPSCNAEREHQQRLAREHQQMVEQLMSSGLVQAADLAALGFTEAEISATGYHLPAQHHRDEEREGEGEEKLAATAVRQGKARKRSWRDSQETPASTPGPSTAPTKNHTAAPKTTAKVVAGDTPALTHRASSALFACSLPATEGRRAAALHDARFVEQRRTQRQTGVRGSCRARSAAAEKCARMLSYEAEEDHEDTAHTSASASTTMAAVHHARAVNTALSFSGLDVAVAKEIAQLLQTTTDEEAIVEQRRMREYLESREDGNTPYM